jgi:hypothetical protein
MARRIATPPGLTSLFEPGQPVRDDSAQFFAIQRDEGYEMDESTLFVRAFETPNLTTRVLVSRERIPVDFIDGRVFDVVEVIITPPMAEAFARARRMVRRFEIPIVINIPGRPKFILTDPLRVRSSNWAAFALFHPHRSLKTMTKASGMLSMPRPPTPWVRLLEKQAPSPACVEAYILFVEYILQCWADDPRGPLILTGHRDSPAEPLAFLLDSIVNPEGVGRIRVSRSTQVKKTSLCPGTVIIAKNADYRFKGSEYRLDFKKDIFTNYTAFFRRSTFDEADIWNIDTRIAHADRPSDNLVRVLNGEVLGLKSPKSKPSTPRGTSNKRVFDFNDTDHFSPPPQDFTLPAVKEITLECSGDEDDAIFYFEDGEGFIEEDEKEDDKLIVREFEKHKCEAGPGAVSRYCHVCAHDCWEGAQCRCDIEATPLYCVFCALPL